MYQKEHADIAGGRLLLVIGRQAEPGKRDDADSQRHAIEDNVQPGQKPYIAGHEYSSDPASDSTRRMVL